jgi:hypothetical protein
MAFSFANAGMGGSPAVNVQAGPPLEDIQTEVLYPSRLLEKHSSHLL